MNFPVEITLQQLFLLIIFGGMATVVGVMIPVQIVSKMRRLRRKRTRSICRICGYRFLRSFERGPSRCPHCSALNK